MLHVLSSTSVTQCSSTGPARGPAAPGARAALQPQPRSLAPGGYGSSRAAPAPARLSRSAPSAARSAGTAGTARATAGTARATPAARTPPAQGSSAALIGGGKHEAGRTAPAGGLSETKDGARSPERSEPSRAGPGRAPAPPGPRWGPTPAPALSDGRLRQSQRGAAPQPRGSANGKARAGAGPGRAEAAAALRARSGAPAGTRGERPGAAGPEALRRRPGRSPSLHRHTAFPYELVQRQVRHLAAAPTMRRSERVPEMTPHDFRSSPRPQKDGGPAPAPPGATRAPQPPAASGPVICIRRGTDRPGSARGSGPAARTGTKTEE